MLKLQTGFQRNCPLPCEETPEVLAPVWHLKHPEHLRHLRRLPQHQSMKNYQIVKTCKTEEHLTVLKGACWKFPNILLKQNLASLTENDDDIYWDKSLTVRDS